MAATVLAAVAGAVLLLLHPPAIPAGECGPGSPASTGGRDLPVAVDRAKEYRHLHTLHVARCGEVLVAEELNGASVDAPTNVKSASKSLIAALVGAAIERGVLQGTDQRIAPLLRDQLPDDPDPRLRDLTVGHLLSMQAGLKRTSGPNYGAWVNSDNWVKAVLAMPFVGEPGEGMLYSTGNSHLLSAILMRETGRSTYELANDWLGPAGITVESWMTDPQGIPLGGNQVAMRPASLLALGELYRNDGRTPAGERILPPEWVERSWTERAYSNFTGDGYGYGWFIREFAGYRGYYGWGYGGQMVYVVPALELTVAITSDTGRPSGRTGYREELHGLLAEGIIPAVERLGSPD